MIFIRPIATNHHQEPAQPHLPSSYSRAGEPEEGSAGQFFQEAASLGASEGVVACQATFAACPYDRKVIFQAFKDIQNDAGASKPL